MKRDIETRADIEWLVNSFYEKVKVDLVIGPIFQEVVKVNWGKHLPVMYDFWENTLFYSGSYEGNPIASHLHLHHIFPLNATHFNKWIELFQSNVDEWFEGTVATLAKQRAVSIATVMKIKILQTGVPPVDPPVGSP